MVQEDYQIIADERAEEATLGSIILDNNLMSEAQNILKPEDFTGNRPIIFATMKKLYEDGSPINSVTIHALNANYKDGGNSVNIDELYVSNLPHGLPFVSTLKPYLTIILDKAKKRQLQRTLYSIAESVDSGTFEETLTELDSRLEPQRSYETDFGFKALSKISDDAGTEIGDLRKGISHAIPTGLASLDRAIRGGGKPGQFHLWGGDTSSGKSSLGKQIIFNVASQGYPCAVVSAEMSDLEIFFRLLGPMSRVPVFKIDVGLSPTEFDYLEWEIPKLSKLPIWIDAKTKNIHNIKANLRALMRRQARLGNDKPWVVLLDYVQLFRAQSKVITSRANMMADVARTSKDIPMELDCWLIGLSQFKREGTKEGDDGKAHPWIHDFLDSSEFEDAADLAGIIEMDEYEIGNPIRNASLTIGKQRGGLAGRKITLPYKFNGDRMEFEEVLNATGPELHKPEAKVRPRTDTQTTPMQFEPEPEPFQEGDF